MCGIFAYCGPRTDAPLLTWQGLQALEYRGYDSWGIASVVDGRISLSRRVGPVTRATGVGFPSASLALGHTRWATHGGVTEANAHPHLDCPGRFAVVHNGIVENHRALREQLGSRHHLRSETDTEILAHLIEQAAAGRPVQDAVFGSLRQIHGLNAVVVCDSATGTLYAARLGSPLAIGLGDGEHFISSDLPSLAPVCRQTIVLEDGQGARVGTDGVQLFDLDRGEPLPVAPIALHAAGSASVRPQDGSHFLYQEICEQPRVLAEVAARFAPEAEDLIAACARARDLWLVGCGTASHAAMLGAQYLAVVADRDARPVVGSEFRWQERLLHEHSVALYLSQSGETVDLLESLRRVRQTTAATAAFVNVAHSTLHRHVQHAWLLPAGPERSVLSTKTFLAKIAGLGLLASQLAGQTADAQAELSAATEEVRRLVEGSTPEVDAVAELLAGQAHAFTLGRGWSLPVALEAALKLKEASYLHVEGLAAGELKHGPLALVEQGTPCIIFAPSDAAWADILSAGQEVKARCGLVIGVAAEPDPSFDLHIPVRDCGRFTVLPHIVVAQLLAYRLALLRGCDPDRPRNLAKSVTVK